MKYSVLTILTAIAGKNSLVEMEGKLIYYPYQIIVDGGNT